MKNVTSVNYGGLILRRILPVVIVIPLVIGGFKIYGEKTGWFSNEFGVSFVAISNLVAFSLFVYILSAYLNRLDAKRKQAEMTLYKINICLLSFGTDPDKNIQLITETVGEITGAACTLYNRRRGEMLVTEAGWKVPPDLNKSDQGEGHICFDVIKGGGDQPTIITDLQHSRYAETDPNVKKYNLQSYIGYPVKLNNEVVASLCAVFGSTIKLGNYPLHLLQILSKAASMEEERNKAQQRQTETFEQLEKTKQAPPTGSHPTHRSGKIPGKSQR